MIEIVSIDEQVPRALLGTHLLVVEDSEDLCRSYGRSLPRLGCTFDIASNVDEALELIEDESSVYHAALLDLGVPGDPDGDELGGLGLIRPLRERSSPCYSVIVSAQGETAAVECAMRRGALDFVHKPFSFGSPEFTRPLVRAIEQSEATCAALGHPLPRYHPIASDVTRGGRDPALRNVVDLGGMVDLVLPEWTPGDRVTEAIVLVMLGFNDQDMGKAMGVSPHTARTHGMRAVKLSGMLHRRDAMRLALQRNGELARDTLLPFLSPETLSRTLDLLQATIADSESPAD